MKNQTEKCDIYWPQKLRKTLSKSATTYYQDEKQRKTLLLISIQCESNFPIPTRKPVVAKKKKENAK